MPNRPDNRLMKRTPHPGYKEGCGACATIRPNLQGRLKHFAFSDGILLISL